MRSLLAALALCGCSVINDPSSFQRDAGRPPEEIPTDELCTRLAELTCMGHYRCCLGMPDPPEREFTDCVAALNDCGESFTTISIEAIISDPIAGYDAVVAAEAVADAEALMQACDVEYRRYIQSRSRFLRFLEGTRGGGEVCTPRDEVEPFDFAAFLSCLDGNVCAPMTSDRYLCGVPTSEGMSCGDTFQCEESLFCEGIPGFKTCVPRRADGMLCTANEQCESLYCNEMRCMTHTQSSAFCIL